MDKKTFSFSVFNEHAVDGIYSALLDFNSARDMPIFVCIGSDLVLGDSLGPLVGTLLKKKTDEAYIYGTLNSPITAKEVVYAKTYLKEMHPHSKIIAIDAAIGNKDDVGLIRVFDKGIKPGLGVEKDLGTIGDNSIIGVVAGKSLQNYNLFNLTRLNLVFKMAEKISDAICEYVTYINRTNKSAKTLA